MKITFLGTSHGYAEKGHFTSGTLIEIPGASYVIDAGAPLESLLVNLDKDPRDIRGIFITHMHADHIGNLHSLTEPFIRFRYNENCVCFLPEKEGLDAYIAWMKAMHTDVEKLQRTVAFHITEEGVIYEQNGLRITAIPTRHMQHYGAFPAFAYMLEHKGKRVLFTGDMYTGFPEYEEVICDREYDLVVCEMAHAHLEDVWLKLSQTKTKKMVINHTWPPCLVNHEEIFAKMPFDIQLAQDNAVLFV